MRANNYPISRRRGNVKACAWWQLPLCRHIDHGVHREVVRRWCGVVCVWLIVFVATGVVRDADRHRAPCGTPDTTMYRSAVIADITDRRIDLVLYRTRLCRARGYTRSGSNAPRDDSAERPWHLRTASAPAGCGCCLCALRAATSSVGFTARWCDDGVGWCAYG